MPVKTLAAHECPLLVKIPDVLTRYNVLAEELLRIRHEDPIFFERAEIQDLVAEAESIQELLSRSHYQVGSIGMHQVSKSTTFNRILRASEADKPAMEGETSHATTAAITRVRPIRPDAAEHRMTLRYLTKQGYVRKRDGLASALAADGVDLDRDASDDELRQRLPVLIEDARRRKISHHEENLGYLQRLIESARSPAGKEILRDGERGFEIDKPYGQRRTYVNHPGDPTTPLLRDVLLEYRTDVVPPEVETIDMPGLGAGLLIDTLLSRELMARLNGVLLFCDVVRDVSSELVARVLGRLREQFPDGLRGRLWLVFTKCDTLAPSHFQSSENNIFTGIRGSLQKFGLTPEQVCFVCNFWDGKSGEFERFLQDRVGTTDLGSRFSDHPELIRAFLELGRNGGIDRLRDLITHVLGDEVSRETQREMNRRLDRLDAELRAAREQREQEKRFDPERQLNLNTILNRIKSVQAHVENQRELLAEGESLIDYFKAPTEKLHDELKLTFDQAYPQQTWIKNDKIERLSQLFPIHAIQLEARLHDLLTSQTLPEVYKQVGESFAGLPIVQLASCPEGVGRQWEEWSLNDRIDRSWRERWKVSSFLDKLLFVPSRIAPIKAMDGLDYRQLMLEKIKVVARQTSHALRMRVREHLLELERNHHEHLLKLEEHYREAMNGSS